MVHGTEEIKTQYTRYVNAGKKFGFITDKFLQFFGTDLMTAPGNKTTSYGGAYPGGLIELMLKTAEYGIKINKILPEGQKVKEEDIMKVSFLYQLGKAFMFTHNKSQWHRDNLGQMYKEVDDLPPLKSWELAIYNIYQTDILLTNDEYIAIMNVEKTCGDFQVANHNNNLGNLLMTAHKIAIKELIDNEQ